MLDGALCQDNDKIAILCFRRAQQVLLETLLLFQDRYESEVAVELVVVESKSDHKAVGYLEAPVIHTHLNDTTRVAVKERADGERIGCAARQRLQQVAQRKSGVDNILYKDHVLSLDALVEVLGDAYHAGGAALVGEARNAQEVYFYRDFDVPCQCGEKKRRTLQDADQLD